MRDQLLYEGLRPPFKPTSPPTSIIVTASMEGWFGPSRSLTWLPRERIWKLNAPGINRLLSDDHEMVRERLIRMDRAEAEQTAREQLGIDLPSEAELFQMFRVEQEKANRQRWQASLIRAYGRPWTSLGIHSRIPSRIIPEKPESTRITYYASYPNPTATKPTGVAAVAPSPDYFRAVAWAPDQQRWIFAPRPVQRFLRDEGTDQEKELVDRATAEQIAREALGTELPSEEEIRRICEEGIRQQHPELTQ